MIYIFSFNDCHPVCCLQRTWLLVGPSYLGVEAGGLLLWKSLPPALNTTLEVAFMSWLAPQHFGTLAYDAKCFYMYITFPRSTRTRVKCTTASNTSQRTSNLSTIDTSFLFLTRNALTATETKNCSDTKASDVAAIASIFLAGRGPCSTCFGNSLRVYL